MRTCSAASPLRRFLRRARRPGPRTGRSRRSSRLTFVSPHLRQQLWLLPVIAFTTLGIWFLLDGRGIVGLLFLGLAALNVANRYLSVKSGEKTPPN